MAQRWWETYEEELKRVDGRVGTLEGNARGAIEQLRAKAKENVDAVAADLEHEKAISAALHLRVDALEEDLEKEKANVVDLQDRVRELEDLKPELQAALNEAAALADFKEAERKREMAKMSESILALESLIHGQAPGPALAPALAAQAAEPPQEPSSFYSRLPCSSTEAAPDPLHPRVADESGLIVEEWMRNPKPCPMPLPPSRCSHGRAEWFFEPFNPDSKESITYFVSARDAISEDNDQLLNKCASATTAWDLPYDGPHYNALYTELRRVPSMFMDHHLPNSGSFYVRFGCSNCRCMTPRYQPQYQWNKFDNQGMTGKGLKQNTHVRTAFRAFIASILVEAELSEELCRFRHTSDYLAIGN